VGEVLAPSEYLRLSYVHEPVDLMVNEGVQFLHKCGERRGDLLK